MKGFIITMAMLASVSAHAAKHPASQFVNDTLTRGKQILELKNESSRRAQLCALLSQRVHTGYINAVWLGEFTKLARERAAIQRFQRMIPSIIITKAFASGGGSMSGGFSVAETANARGNGYFDVAVTVATGGGSTYSGKAIVYGSGSNFRIVDAEYLGFSAVNHMASDYQQFLTREYNKNTATSMPVTALVQAIRSEQGFIACN